MSLVSADNHSASSDVPEPLPETLECAAADKQILEAMHQLRISPLAAPTTSDWSEYPVDEERVVWDESHVSPLDRLPLYASFPSVRTIFPVGVLQFRMRPATSAVIATDRNFVAGLTDTMWFRWVKIPNWHYGVLESLQYAGVTRVHCCEKDLKVSTVCRDLNMDAEIELYPERYALKYVCKICGERDCAVQRAFLSWRRMSKKKPCNLEH